MDMSQQYRTGIYSDSFTQLTYNALVEETESCLKRNQGVIVDATLKNPEHRRLFLNLATSLGVPILFVECQAEAEEIFRRLKEREQKPEEVSDATWEVYLRQREEFVPLSDIPDSHRLIVNTTATPEAALDQVEEFLYHPRSR
jgi:predicted kinase